MSEVYPEHWAIRIQSQTWPEHVVCLGDHLEYTLSFHQSCRIPHQTDIRKTQALTLQDLCYLYLPMAPVVQ